MATRLIATSNIATPPLDGMPVHPRVTPSIKLAGIHLYTWVESIVKKEFEKRKATGLISERD